MTINIDRARPLDMSDPNNRRDRLPDPETLPGVQAVAGAPRDLTVAEAVVLVALHRGARTVADVLAQTGQQDAIRPAIDRLVARGLTGRGREHGSLLNLTNPTGRALARALADNRRGAPTT
jgi:hypothetical protein